MNYTVIWLPEAENELAAVWMASARRQDVTTAASELDRRLSANGPGEGESRADGRRITFEPPLAVVFRFYPAENTVRVIQVWEYRGRSR